MDTNTTDLAKTQDAPALALAPGSASERSLAFRRVLRTKRLLAESGHDGVTDALKELAALRDALRRIKEQTKDYDRYSLPAVIYRIASDALKPNWKYATIAHDNPSPP